MNNQQYGSISNPRTADTASLSDMPIAMAYVPWQQPFSNVYDLDKGFHAGTIFPCLDKRFLGRSGCK